MKKNWLRGLLLGVSLTLLLGGGVALAQRQMAFTVDQHCFECCAEGVCTPIQGEGTIVPPEQYRVDLGFSNLNMNKEVCQRIGWESDGLSIAILISLHPPYTGPSCSQGLWITCDGEIGIDQDCVDMLDARVSESGALDLSDLHGEWDWWVWQEQECHVEPPESADHFTVRFSDDCPEEQEEEFVPEPGSLLLLGSGLAGLAGYATLRLRSGQALRRRTRE